MRSRVPNALLLASWLCAPGAAAAPMLDQLVLARDVICSFHKSGPSSLVDRAPQRADDLMVIIEGIGVDPGSASVISSRSVGPKPARVYAPDTRVHFVEDVNDSVIVTTMLDCETWNDRGEARRCTRYGAVVTWHFDRSVHVDPDRSFLALPGNSYAGHCEPWNLE